MKRLVLTFITSFAIFLLAIAGSSTQQVSPSKKSPSKTQTSVKKTSKSKSTTVLKKDTAKTVVAEKHNCIYITKADFIKRVDNFEQDPNNWKYLGDKPCIIDFYTTWCGPCRMLAPILEELAKEYEGKIYIYKADAEKEADLARVFQVQAYPTLVFCSMTGNPQMSKGALPKEQLVEIIEQTLLKKQAPAPPPLLQRR